MSIPQQPPLVHRGITVKAVEPPGPGYKQIKNKARHTVTVTLKNGHDATFRCQSKSLKTALEMIEVFSQETASITDATAFDTHKKSMYGKKVWFDLSQDQTGGDLAISYKADKHGSTLISAFQQKSLSDQLIEELKKTAKAFKNKPNSNDINLHLNRDDSEVNLRLDRTTGLNRDADKSHVRPERRHRSASDLEQPRETVNRQQGPVVRGLDSDSDDFYNL